MTTYGILPAPVRHTAGASTIVALDETGSGRAFVAAQSLSESLRKFAYTLRWLGPQNWLRAWVGLS